MSPTDRAAATESQPVPARELAGGDPLPVSLEYLACPVRTAAGEGLSPQAGRNLDRRRCGHLCPSFGPGHSCRVSCIKYVSAPGGLQLPPGARSFARATTPQSCHQPGPEEAWSRPGSVRRAGHGSSVQPAGLGARTLRLTGYDPKRAMSTNSQFKVQHGRCPLRMCLSQAQPRSSQADPRVQLLQVLLDAKRNGGRPHR